MDANAIFSLMEPDSVPPYPWNILLLCADDHRADAIGGLGHPLLRTPNWDRLLREGIAFTQAFVTAPIGPASRAELLTGYDAAHTGVRWFGDAIDPALTLLPQAFANAGYETFFTGKWHNDGSPTERGYGEARRVFTGEVRDQRMSFEENGKTVTGFSSELFAEAAADFIRAREDSQTPWLARVAFTAPHDPRTPPVGWRVESRRVPLPPNFMPEHPFDNGAMTTRDELLLPWPRTEEAVREHLSDYYGMLLHLDAQVGRILAALDAADGRHNTLVIYLSDHGLALGSHGLMGKMNLYDHSVRIPLILRGPGIPEGEQTAALCTSGDLFPTLCDLCGVPIPSTVRGKSLSPILRRETDTHREHVYGACRDEQRMVRTDRYKYIHYPRIGKEQLFDLETDPHELINLLDEWRFRPSRDFTPSATGSEYRLIADALKDRLPE